MLFLYKSVTKEGLEVVGEIDAQNQDSAVATLQKKGLVVVSVRPADKKQFFEVGVVFWEHVSAKEIAMVSRQIATLLGAHVPALKTFRLLANESENPVMAKKFTEISDDIQNGVSISDALFKHPAIFSDFYVNMVRAGEESGKLSEVFESLANHLERSYELMAKARGALVYPAFIVMTFFIVMVLMFTMVIPKLSDIIAQSGQEMPFYTKIVIDISTFLVNYGLFAAVVILTGAFLAWRSVRHSDKIEHLKLSIPGIGTLYRMIYLSRIADNMETMLGNGISMVRGIEITSRVVGNDIYRGIMEDAATQVKTGAALSQALSKHPEIPNVMIQMVKVGEETGELGSILGKLSVFYQREVNNAIATILSMIEPVMIVALGIGVGGVLASVLIPIYQIAGGI